MAERGILDLIEMTKRWRSAHRTAGRMIEAAACAIRLRALEDALEKVREGGND